MLRRPCAAALLMACVAAGCAARAVPKPFPGAPDSASSPAGRTPPQLPLLATALTLRGTPYRNGGSDARGFDCSGFVQYVFAMHGRALPREVREQYRVGSSVSRGNVRPGDLVFFETVSSGPSHVGIALGGDEFVHAPSSRGVVRVEKYTSEYWARRWVGARRVG